jgi:hypothetical protein
MMRTSLKPSTIAAVAAVPLVVLTAGTARAYADDVNPPPGPAPVEVGSAVEIGPAVEIGSPGRSDWYPLEPPPD